MLLTKVAHQSAIFRRATARIKIHQIPRVIFGTKKRNFSSNFALPFIAMRHNSSVLFHLNVYMLWTKEAHQKVQIFRLSRDCMKISQISFVVFQATSQFSFKF